MVVALWQVSCLEDWITLMYVDRVLSNVHYKGVAAGGKAEDVDIKEWADRERCCGRNFASDIKERTT